MKNVLEMAEIKFEDEMNRLQEIVDTLEKGDIDLDNFLSTLPDQIGECFIIYKKKDMNSSKKILENMIWVLGHLLKMMILY